MRRETRGGTAAPRLAGFSSWTRAAPGHAAPASALTRRLRRGIRVMRFILSRQRNAESTLGCADGISQPSAVQATGPTHVDRCQYQVRPVPVLRRTPQSTGNQEQSPTLRLLVSG